MKDKTYQKNNRVINPDVYVRSHVDNDDLGASVAVDTSSTAYGMLRVNSSSNSCGLKLSADAVELCVNNVESHVLESDIISSVADCQLRGVNIDSSGINIEPLAGPVDLCGDEVELDFIEIDIMSYVSSTM